MRITAKSKAAFIRLCQMLYLTAAFYVQNNLDACASACTFGFIFSFIPILMMFLTIFIGILHVSPSMLQEITHLAEQVNSVFDIDGFISGLSRGISVSWVNVVLSVFIIWMARKLFLSIIKGISRIFNTVARRRPFVQQLLTIAGELLIVIICVIVFFAAFITRQIFSLPIFDSISGFAPLVFGSISNALVNLALYIVIFISSTLAYRFASGTRPKLRLCLLHSALCTALFYACVLVISLILNKAKYNTIYGVLSNMIILLLEVYIFFSLFMFFAQAIYTTQFFTSLLLGELYLLPLHDSTSLPDTLRRILFITPSALMTKENTVAYRAGEPIYALDETVEGVYYIASGTVAEDRGGTQMFHDKGTFFGEVEFLLNCARLGTTTAKTDCEILRIDNKEFADLIDKNPKAAVKAVSKLSLHTAKVYGRNACFLV